MNCPLSRQGETGWEEAPKQQNGEAVRLMKWLAGDEDVTEINESNADVDDSPRVDEKDLLRLMRFLAGEEGTELI